MDNSYDDIINMPHHVSDRHQQMTIESRAAQFSPFSALTGYSDAVKEKARITDKKIEIDENIKEIINNKLQIIKDNIKNNPEIEIKYFIKDINKSGGKYNKIKDNVKKIDIYNKLIIMNNNEKIKFKDIIDITSSEIKLDIDDIN